MFGRRMKHTQRYQEILNAFLKNGLSHFLFRMGLVNRDRPDEAIHTKATSKNLTDIGIRLRKTLQELGPAFIKLGQIASTRRDIIPKEIIIELEKL